MDETVLTKKIARANSKAKSNDIPLLQLLHRASQQADALFADAVADDSLTTSQFLILRALSTLGTVSQAHISHETGIDRSTTAGIVRRLVKQGRIKRKRNRGDARAYDVCLTDKGKHALRLATQAATRMENAASAATGQQKAGALKSQLRVFVKAMETKKA